MPQRAEKRAKAAFDRARAEQQPTESVVTALIINRVDYLIKEAQEKRGQLQLHYDINDGTTHVLDMLGNVRAVNNPKSPDGHLREIRSVPESDGMYASIIHLTPVEGKPTITIQSPEKKDTYNVLRQLHIL